MITLKMVRIGVLYWLVIAPNVHSILEEYIVDANGMLIPAREAGQQRSDGVSSDPISSYGEQHQRIDEELTDHTVRRPADETLYEYDEEYEDDDKPSYYDYFDEDEERRLAATRLHPKATTSATLMGNGNRGNYKQQSRKSEAGIKQGTRTIPLPPKRDYKGGGGEKGKKKGEKGTNNSEDGGSAWGWGGKGYEPHPYPKHDSKKGGSKSEDGGDFHIPPHPPPTKAPVSPPQGPLTTQKWKTGPIFGKSSDDNDDYRDKCPPPKIQKCFVKVPDDEKKKPIPKWKKLHKIRKKYYGYGKGKGSGSSSTKDKDKFYIGKGNGKGGNGDSRKYDNGNGKGNGKGDGKGKGNGNNSNHWNGYGMEHGNSQGQQKGKDSKTKYDDPKKGMDKLTKEYQQEKKNTDRKKVFNSNKGSRNHNNNYRNVLDSHHKPPRQLWERPKIPNVTPWDKYKNKDDDYHDYYHDKYDDHDHDDDDYDDWKKEFLDLENFSYFPIYCFVDDGSTPGPAPLLDTFSPTASSIPSFIPSDQPSTMPSVEPSNAPSLLPSYNPTGKPSQSVIPSVEPSEPPSASPSDSPSTSNQPSVTPTTSSQPSSIEPSESSSPSSPPSNDPSVSPSDPPTNVPSDQPSKSMQPSTLAPTISNQPTTTVAPSDPPSMSPTETFVPSSTPTEAPRCVVRSNLALCESRFVNFTEIPDCDCYNFCGDVYVGCCDFESECDINCVGLLVAGCIFPTSETDGNSTDIDSPATIPTPTPTESKVPSESMQPTEIPTESNVPTESLMPTEVPSVDPTGYPTTSVQPSSIPSESMSPTRFVCAVTTNTGLCQDIFIDVDQQKIPGCNCYNYCNGVFNGCCAFGEVDECEQDCVGTVVSGCRFLTEAPTSSPQPSDSPRPSNAPTDSFPPTSSPMPSTSPTKSESPTGSFQPTTTKQPSEAPTSSFPPSGQPTASVQPTIGEPENTGNETATEPPVTETEAPGNTTLSGNGAEEPTGNETVASPFLAASSGRHQTRFTALYEMPPLARTQEATLDDLSELETITSMYLRELLTQSLNVGFQRNQHEDYADDVVTRIVGVRYDGGTPSRFVRITFRTNTEPTSLVVSVLKEVFDTPGDSASNGYLEFVRSLPTSNPLSLTTSVRLVEIVEKERDTSLSNPHPFLVRIKHFTVALLACVAALAAMIASMVLCWRREKRRRQEALHGAGRYEELKFELVHLEQQLTEAFERRQFNEVKRLQKELANKREGLFARLDALDMLRRMKTGGEGQEEEDLETWASSSYNESIY